MKYAQEFPQQLPGHRISLIACLFVILVGIAGCGGSGSTPAKPVQVSDGPNSTAEESLIPPGGMELPSDLNVSDTPAPASEKGSAFELPE